MAETAGGYWDVLRWYLYVAVYFGPLVVQAGLCPGRDICGEAFPNIPIGDEVAGCPHAWVGGPVEVVEYLSTKVSGHQRAECTGEGVTDEVEVAILLREDAGLGWSGELVPVGKESVGEPCPLDPGVLCRRWLHRPRGFWPWPPAGG